MHENHYRRVRLWRPEDIQLFDLSGAISDALRITEPAPRSALSLTNRAVIWSPSGA